MIGDGKSRSGGDMRRPGMANADEMGVWRSLTQKTRQIG